MITATSAAFGKYTGHVLKWEGGTSKDPRDTAASCAPFAGAFHTVKGVTYCTFKTLAGELGILPVNYDRFITMTDQDIAKFVYRFYQSVNGDRFPDSIAIAMTEAAWWSGPARSFKYLRDAVKNLGYYLPSGTGYSPQLEAIVKTIPEKTLFNQYMAEWKKFAIDYLGNLPKYAMFKKGWTNRLNDFILKFSPAGSAAFMLIAVLGVFLILK